MADYAAWPIENDVLGRLASAGIVVRTTAAAQEILDAVAAEVSRRTLRQFLPDGSDTSRVYDGTGTAEIEVDEMVSLTQVAVIGYEAAPGYILANTFLVGEQNKPQTRIVCARGSLPALVAEGFIAPFPYIFPLGRQNVEVTGKFGYADLIPADLWECVCGEMAYRMALEAIFKPGGRVTLDQRGDVKKQYALAEPAFMGWHDRFEWAMSWRGYKRPAGRRLRNLRSRMQ